MDTPRCDHAALAQASPRGAEFDTMAHCTADATTTRWTCRGASNQRRHNYCDQHAAQVDAYILKLRDGVDRSVAADRQPPLAHHLRTRVHHTPTGRDGTVVGLPSRHWPRYTVCLDGCRWDDVVDCAADELTALPVVHDAPAFRSGQRRGLPPVPKSVVPVERPAPYMVTVRPSACLL